LTPRSKKVFLPLRAIGAFSQTHATLARARRCCDAAGAYQHAHATPSQAAMMSFFRAKQLGIPAARWGVAAGSIGFFLLYEDLPQLILQTPYGNFPGWTGVAVAFGMMKDPKAE
jgi:hypothetical protein